MPQRKLLPLWIVASIFLASVTAVPLTCRLCSWSTSPPTATELRTLTELAKALSNDAPDCQVVPTMKNGSLEMGMHLCKGSRSWDELSLLPLQYEHADKWQGVVYCVRVGKDLWIDESQIQRWGEHALRIEPFLFFGDPDLLRRIDWIIRNHAKREPH